MKSVTVFGLKDSLTGKMLIVSHSASPSSRVSELRASYQELDYPYVVVVILERENPSRAAWRAWKLARLYKKQGQCELNNTSTNPLTGSLNRHFHIVASDGTKFKSAAACARHFKIHLFTVYKRLKDGKKIKGGITLSHL